MAFIVDIELPSGLVAVDTYCSIQVNSSKPSVTIICDFYVSAESKKAGKPPITTLYKQFARQDMENINPLDYGYQLLEASGEFPDATWNV